MSTLAKNVLVAGVKNRPPTLEKGGYDTWQHRMLLYIKGKEHGKMMPDSILLGPFLYKVVTFLANEAMGVVAVTRMVKELMEGRKAQGYGNAGRGRVTRSIWVVKIAGELNAIHPKMIRCYNCKGEENYAKHCTINKRFKDSKWFKEKMLHTQQQEARIEIADEQQDFLADGLEEIDDAPTANAILIAKLSHVGLINEDDVGLSYDSYILSDVPYYDTYHANDMINPFVQESPASEQLVSVTNTDVDFLNDSNVISDNRYLDNNENEVV
nr:hypothetical protein [Tanacetum cinerariifolium]GEY44099.1 hypothetical protein [Tanacetum cinerariifolium]